MIEIIWVLILLPWFVGLCAVLGVFLWNVTMAAYGASLRAAWNKEEEADRPQEEVSKYWKELIK